MIKLRIPQNLTAGDIRAIQSMYDRASEELSYLEDALDVVRKKDKTNPVMKTLSDDFIDCLVEFTEAKFQEQTEAIKIYSNALISKK
jgi:hypothetical protein